MSAIANKQIVLRLNANWLPIGVTTVDKAFVSMCSETNGKPSTLALDVRPLQLADGTYDFSEIESATPVAWEDWIKLPINPWDLTIDTTRGPIRVPTIVISSMYAGMPLKSPRLTKQAIFARDGKRCQYTGKLLSYSEMTVDHVIPRARGGRDVWDNLVTCEKKLNHKKGSALNEEAGLKLLKKPKAPPTIPLMATIGEAKHPSWQHFLIRGAN